MRCSTGTSPLDNKDYNIASPPLYFVRSGYLNGWSGDYGLIRSGEYGSELVADNYVSPEGYHFLRNMNFDDITVRANGTNNIYVAFPVLCPWGNYLFWIRICATSRPR